MMSKLNRMSKLARYCLTGIAVLSVAVLAVPPAIQIYTLDDLKKVGTDPFYYPLDGYYVLMNDINIPENQLWTPIGKSIVEMPEVLTECPWSGFGVMPGYPFEACPDGTPLGLLYAGAFKGTLIGNGHTIRGLRVDYVLEFPGGTPPAAVSAGLFGALDGATIADLNIEAETISVGSLYFAAGGALAGFVRNSTIRNTNVKGALSGITRAEVGSNLNVGGLVGRAENSIVTSSSAVVTVRAMLGSTNGLGTGADGTIGGLMGVSLMTTINDCHAITAIGGSGGRSIGGLVGENLGGTITKSSAVTKIAPVNTIMPISPKPEVAFVNIGGLVGHNMAGSPLSCPEESDNCFLGMVVPGVINQSYAAVNLEGVVGISQANAAIYGAPSNVGGLVGMNYGISQIHDCYAVGTIESSNTRNIFGGLVGIVNNSLPSSILRNYAAVAINVDVSQYTERGDTRGGLVGVLVGIPESGLDVLNFNTSYWDTDILPGVMSSLRGEHGKTTDEMMTQSTFVDWDFENVWRIGGGVNEGEKSYPYLAWQAGSTTSISGRQIARGANKNSLAPRVTVRGKTLNVKTLSSTQNLQVRLIDMRGRTATRFDMTGGGNMPLNRISAGRYIVDMRDMETGRRFSSPIVVR